MMPCQVPGHVNVKKTVSEAEGFKKTFFFGHFERPQGSCFWKSEIWMVQTDRYWMSCDMWHVTCDSSSSSSSSSRSSGGWRRMMRLQSKTTHRKDIKIYSRYTRISGLPKSHDVKGWRMAKDVCFERCLVLPRLDRWVPRDHQTCEAIAVHGCLFCFWSAPHWPRRSCLRIDVLYCIGVLFIFILFNFHMSYVRYVICHIHYFIYYNIY